ncbi:DUF2062 domain-containing protein [Sedimentimonas flavescens]|uniref:DUF2062 domain-containing protein n=1 Tax=Sedimentimonas flavescens TaxID=2851012 RepID=UPI001C4A48DE|nr:DUF2062 domain-containing protein [Sedimentimonas flavescens]MBW0158608.1 DUF2062 domain-containing protein [Sedimentimonas flavescens]
MVFKRREKRPFLSTLRESVWPRSGWTRAFHYVKHRVNRLPDQPHRIARGVFAGVFISFTPFFGFHFLTAAAVALMVRGNIIASLLATFFGNPITFPIIAVSSVKLGQWMLGRTVDGHQVDTLGETFLAAGHDLKHNIVAAFTPAQTEWGGLAQFFNDIWLPYLVGGFIPGIVSGLICYYVSLPIIDAYQKRRRTRLKERLEKIRAKLAHKREERKENNRQEPPAEDV